MTLSIWVSVLMVGAILFAATYYFYPQIENLLLSRFKVYAQSLVDLCDRMFMNVTIQRASILLIVSTTVFFAIGFYFTFGFGFINIFFTLFFAFLGFSIPKFVLQIMWERRIQLFNEQLIDSLNLLSNSIKSGLNLSQAIQILVREMPNPISQEFAMVLSQEKIGLTIDDTLQKMTERIPSEDLSVVIQSILILRETGGNLSETFDVIANTIRERRRIDGKIKSMTAQGKTQGIILFVLPFAFLLFLYFINPPYVSPLFKTQLGWVLISIMLVFQILGGLWIRKIIKIEV